MKPFLFLILAVAFSSSLFLSLKTPHRQRPNVVFILTDDMGWRDLGCYGNSFNETPQIDKLAASGMRFTQAYAACPVCSPTRASIMTGKYPARLQLTDFIPGRNARTDAVFNDKLTTPAFQQSLPLDETTLAELFRANGYATAIVGKWHLGESKDRYPDKQGFTQTIGVAPGGSPPGYFYPYATSRWALDDLKETGQPGEYLTDRLADETSRLITQLKGRPFFLYLAHYAPHIPLQARQALLAKYEQKKQRLVDEAFANPHYAAMMESIDSGVGQIIETLKRERIYDNTILVFTSDNGGLSVKEGPNTPATSNLPLRDGKGFLSEGGIRIPLLIRWPGLTKAGLVSDAQLCTIDYFPTFTEMLTGRPLTSPEIDGVSFVKTLSNGRAPAREALYWHYPHYSNQGGRPSAAIRQGDYKLIEHYEDGQLELFNLANDVGETRNLVVADPKRAEVMQQKLHQWQHLMQAAMPTSNAAYKAKK
ncbi:sulfatase [Nibrella viscosa]|uniref:Sulfatase n=1 Tax=Nibrella viscosa TaxID=1084524 RepID=A0ABP8JS03_9BACT